jgi:hypothetical protein
MNFQTYCFYLILFEVGNTYAVTIRYKVTKFVSKVTVGIGFARENSATKDPIVSTGATLTEALVVTERGAVTDGWETLTATLSTTDFSRKSMLKILLAGAEGNEIVIGDVTVAKVKDIFYSVLRAKLNAMDTPIKGKKVFLDSGHDFF